MIKNIVDRYIEIVKEEFKEYSKLTLGKNFDLEIFNTYLSDYIDARYYNFIDDENIRTFRDKIIKVINNVQDILEIKRPFDKKIIADEANIFKNLLAFDSVSIVQSEKSAINSLNEIYLQNNTKDYFKSRFIEKNVFYENKKNELKEKYESDVFYLKYKKLDLNVYYANLSYKIKFPKIYNREFIENTFNSGITNEDKLQVEYSMLSKEILNEILVHNFKRKYIVELPETLITKEKKIKSILNIINSSAIQEKISLLISNNSFIKNKNEIYTLMQKGYKFSLYIDNSFKTDIESVERLKMFEFVILDIELKDYDNIKENIKNIKNLIEI